jgi:hypothetical protein
VHGCVAFGSAWYLPGAGLPADPKNYDEKCLERILKVCLKGSFLPSEQDE